MQHCTPEQLALAALREPLPAEDSAHLASCDRCRAEVRSLQRSVDAVAVPQLAAPGAPVAPPPRVWEAIAAATGVSATPRADAVHAPAAVAVAGAPTPPAGDADVLPFRSRRRSLLLVAAAVLAGAVVGAGAVAVVQGREDGGEPVTAVALDPLAGNEASGRAEVVVRDDGSRVVEVELDAPALDDEYYEIWLIDREVAGMVPLGVVRPGTQTFELPADLDLGEFPLVDVSVEPLDGDPTHSGVSVARGELDS
ncbi:anti-sigma factor [Blastococcus mobilis]|uniref:Anti-sigma-K factor rskA n=1 Tax=Blastococcus mobilis TaxID=1938746 RepID=A0A238WMV2_9ACTN|nr:anti-sigma factor [Blastococcus mobilis]SNR47584.1 Anti-sigma-K factor rskA [Blastococcus mobilis]